MSTVSNSGTVYSSWHYWSRQYVQWRKLGVLSGLSHNRINCLLYILSPLRLTLRHEYPLGVWSHWIKSEDDVQIRSTYRKCPTTYNPRLGKNNLTESLGLITSSVVDLSPMSDAVSPSLGISQSLVVGFQDWVFIGHSEQWVLGNRSRSVYVPGRGSFRQPSPSGWSTDHVPSYICEPFTVVTDDVLP